MRADLLDHVRTERRDLLNMPRLMKGIADLGLDAVIASSPTNITYTGGAMKSMGSTMLTFVVTTAQGQQGVVTDEADAYYFREYSRIQDIRSFRYIATTALANQRAVEILVDMLDEMGLVNAKLGIEKSHLPASHWEEIVIRLPRAELADATDVFEYARLVKTPSEIELYRIAAYYTDKAISIAFASAKPGDSEKAVTSHMQAAVLQLGADALDSETVLGAGQHSTIVHAWPLEAKRLEPGEVVHVDTGAIFGGYGTDVSRNAVVGSATQKQETIYRRLWEIEQLVFESMHPGVVAGELFDLAQQAFQKANLVYPWGTLGHSIGLMVHEGFEIVHGSEKILETGMLINIEPSHIEEGDARYHIEDTVLVTDDGIEVLSSFMPTESMFVIN